MKERVRLSLIRAIPITKGQLPKREAKLWAKYLRGFILLTRKKLGHLKTAIFQKSQQDGMSFLTMKPQSKHGYQIM